MKLKLLLAFALATQLQTAAAQEGNYTDERCTENEECVSLANLRSDYGPVEAEVMEVIDADSLRLRLHLLPGLEYVVNVRSRGVDAPEVRGHQCQLELQLAEEAKQSIEGKFQIGTWVIVRNIEYDKYAGRIVADIDRWISDRFQNVTEELLDQPGRWGVPYDGSGPRHNWCEDEFGEPE